MPVKNAPEGGREYQLRQNYAQRQADRQVLEKDPVGLGNAIGTYKSRAIVKRKEAAMLKGSKGVSGSWISPEMDATLQEHYDTIRKRRGMK